MRHQVSVVVLVSNLGGGIQKHLDLVSSVTPIDVHELTPAESLLAKTRTARGSLSRMAPNTVITHGVAAAVAARYRGRRNRGVRHVEFWHGDPFFLSPGRLPVYRALVSGGRTPDLQIFTHEWLVPLFSSKRADHRVLPNTVPVTGVGDEIKTAESCRAVYVGRLSREKGIDDLMRAWPADSLDRGWTLDVYGDGPMIGKGIPRGVRFRGVTDDPLAVLRAAALVVIPSWTETGPYSAYEAMSVGRPFVGTSTGDMPELLRSGCGWEVPPRDIAALQSALVEAQSAPADELSARGELGRGWLRSTRPFEAWAKAVVEIYAHGNGEMG